MKREEVLQVLRDHRPELEAQGVVHAALFGSLARNEARADSDIDVFVEIDPNRPMGIFGYTGVVLFIQGLFKLPVDVAERRALRDHVRPSAEKDAVFAF